jgi:hypothetical protein
MRGLKVGSRIETKEGVTGLSKAGWLVDFDEKCVGRWCGGWAWYRCFLQVLDGGVKEAAGEAWSVLYLLS